MSTAQRHDTKTVKVMIAIEREVKLERRVRRARLTAHMLSVLSGQSMETQQLGRGQASNKVRPGDLIGAR